LAFGKSKAAEQRLHAVTDASALDDASALAHASALAEQRLHAVVDASVLAVASALVDVCVCFGQAHVAVQPGTWRRLLKFCASAL